MWDGKHGGQIGHCGILSYPSCLHCAFPAHVLLGEEGSSSPGEGDTQKEASPSHPITELPGLYLPSSATSAPSSFPGPHPALSSLLPFRPQGWS